MNQRTQGMTLPELMAVIAIMAILMAMIVPAFNTARENANRSSDVAEMNTLRSALQQYHADHGVYPPALLGYITRYTKSAQLFNVPPAEKVHHVVNGLYPGKISGLDTFRPYANRVPQSKYLQLITAARYPNQDPRPLPNTPLLDLNGDGKIDSLDDVLGARQAFGPQNGFVCQGENKMASLPSSAEDMRVTKFYKVSGYDVAEVPIADDAFPHKRRVELRYTRFWTQYALQRGGNENDDPRQLGYSDPPDNTIVTWNSFYRAWERTGNSSERTPTTAKKDIVLFLGGAAKPFNSKIMHERSWRVLPTDG